MPNIKYSKELLEPIVKNSKCIAEVIRALGLVERGGNFATIKKQLKKFNIDASHFTGQAWAKGLTIETSPSIKSMVGKRTKHTPETSLVKDVHIDGKTLHRLLKQINLKYVCASCGIKHEWNGKPITLQVDHINGNHRDNRLENLRYLCPNCHSQTDTFCGKNLK